jgi:hypothetical protein
MWRALKNDVFGKMWGEVFEAPLHAVQGHLDKGEVEEVKEEVAKTPLADAVEVGKAYEEKLSSPVVRKRGRPKK